MKNRVTVLLRVCFLMAAVVLGGQSGNAKNPPLFDRDFRFAGWSGLLGAVPYVGNTILITGSVYSGTKLVKQDYPWTHKAAIYPFLAGIAALNGYAMYLCYDHSDNLLPGILTGGLGSGVSIALGTLTAKYLQRNLSVQQDRPLPLALCPAVAKGSTGLTVRFCF